MFDVVNTGILEVFAGLTEAALDVPMGGDGVRVGGSDTSSLDDVATEAGEEITLIGVDICLEEDVAIGPGVDMSLIVESGRIVEVCLSDGVEVEVAEGEMFVDVCLAEVTTGTGVDVSLADTGRLVEVCFNDVTASVEMIFEEVGAIIEDVGVVQTTVVERCIKLCNHRSTLHAVPELV